MRRINHLADRLLSKLMTNSSARAQAGDEIDCIPFEQNGMHCLKCPTGVFCLPPPVD